jgi:hypothetical protein
VISHQSDLEFGWGPGNVGDGYSHGRDCFIIRAKLGSERILCLVSLEFLEDNFPAERPWESLSAGSAKKIQDKFREMARRNEFRPPMDPTFHGRELIICTRS